MNERKGTKTKKQKGQRSITNKKLVDERKKKDKDQKKKKKVNGL